MEDNGHEAMRLVKRRVLINSTDRVSGNTADFTINLPQTLRDVVSVDWVIAQLSNSGDSLVSVRSDGNLLAIDEFNRTGSTSSNAPFWRHITQSANNRYNAIDEAFDQPRNIQRLTFHWRDVYGNIPTRLSTLYFTSSMTGQVVPPGTPVYSWNNLTAYSTSQYVTNAGLIYQAVTNAVTANIVAGLTANPNYAFTNLVAEPQYNSNPASPAPQFIQSSQPTTFELVYPQEVPPPTAFTPMTQQTGTYTWLVVPDTTFNSTMSRQISVVAIPETTTELEVWTAS